MHHGDSPIRVLQVVRPAEGGMRRHLELLCPRLKPRAVDTLIVAPREFSPNVDVPVVRAPITPRPNPIHDIHAALIVASAAREVDLLHGHGLRGAWIACLAGGRARKPYLFTAHNLAPPSSRLAAALMRRAAHKAVGVIAVSNAVARSLEIFGILPASVHVIPNGIDLTPFENEIDARVVRGSLGIPPDGAVIASAGRLSPEKGFHILLEGAPAVFDHHPEASIVIAGDGPEAPRLSAMAKSLGIADRLILPGRFADIPALFASSEIVAVPSLSEGQGLVVLEGMAARQPVVASSVGGIPEVVEDARSGLLVPPGDSVALARMLGYLLVHEDVRQRIGAAGRARVEALFTADRMADRIAALYYAVSSDAR